MMAVGMDLFFYRVTPSNAFDALPFDFNHEALLLILVGLVGACLFLNYRVNKMKLEANWK